MDRSSIVKILIMLGVVVAALMFDKSNNQELASASTRPLIAYEVAKVSSDRTIQAAYERCRHETMIGLQRDNPTLPQDMMEMMLKATPDICKDMFSASCANGLTAKHCQLAIKPYQH